MAASKPQRRPGVKDPFQIGVQKPFYTKLFYPASVGSMTAAALVVSPRLLGTSPPVLSNLPRPLSSLPTSASLALIGFTGGYLATHAADWLRWKLIQRLLAYQNWVYGAKAIKTRMWALLLKMLKGPGPAKTYDYQRYIPKQPLPDLNHTLDTWLNVAAQLVNREEFEQTKAAVERFRQNEGPKLQQHLAKRHKSEVNWLSEYWLAMAYLSVRDPVCINSSYFLLGKTLIDNIGQLDRASGSIRVQLEFYEMLENNKLPPVELQDMVPLCMNGYRYIYGATRIPGEHIDRIQRYPGETHIVVIRGGHYYTMEVIVNVRDRRNKRRILTTHEIRKQLEYICVQADALDQPLPVAALTSQNRTKWAKQRELLKVKNAETLKCVESALFVVTLDHHSPQDVHEHCQVSLSGRGGDRWYDKSFNNIYYPTGVYGATVEHSGIDAMVITSQSEYQMMKEPEHYCADGLIPTDDIPDASLPSPTYLNWDVEDMADDINLAKKEFVERARDLEAHVLTTKYGKGFMKKCRLSPDGFIQMSMQLAYYRLHKETPKTYEPSTSRLYALGRTENIHPMSAQSKAWVKAMMDPGSPNQTRRDLLKKAISIQTKARLQATIGQGCDKHLFGLYCAARELGMDVPTLYLDKAWQLPFKLSTSQTPTRIVELGADCDYRWVLGGFGPVCHNGYGICYVLLGDEFMSMAITAFNSCEETSAKRLSDAIEDSLEDMKQLFS